MDYETSNGILEPKGVQDNRSTSFPTNYLAYFNILPILIVVKQCFDC